MMKRFKRICFLFLVILPITSKSQEILDYAYIRASYEFSYKTDPKQTEYAKTDLMYLDIGEKVSKFYNRNEQIRDSIANEGLRKGLSVSEINARKQEYDPGTRTVNYNFPSEQKRMVASNFGFLFLYYEEVMQMPQWSIINETKKIQGYTCRKATTTYLGREWIVYFTSEVSVNQGPWKLWGLPGFIVEATDKNSLFKYALKGFEELTEKTPVIFLHTSYKKKYTKSDKATFRKIENLYYSDTKSFMDIYLGLKNGTAYNSDGSIITRKLSIPHIPLEPW